MKKFTYLFLLLLTAQAVTSQAVAPYSQDFNGIVAGGDNSSIVANWTQYSYGAATNDGDIWNGWSLNPGLADDSGAYTLYHDDDETAAGTGVDNWFVLYLDCSSQDEVTFSYDEFQTYNTSYYDFHGVYTSEDYDVANGDAGTQPNGTWTLLREGPAAYSLTNQSFTLPNTTTAIAFRYTGEWADNWFIDNITVGQCTADAPVSVSTPIAPLDAATDVPILIDGDSSLVNFQWPADADVGSYTLNVSTSLTGFPNIGSLTIGANSVNVNYSWATNTTYYWSIDSSNCAGSAEGSIFSFTTGNTEVLQTVFERLQGNVYRQIESPADCGTCEEEINYYMFSAEGLRIIGTEYDGTCEQDDFTAFGTGDGEGEIVTDTTEEFEVCVGFLCQTITFTSDAEDEIQFDFPFFNQTWTAQLYEDEVPCLGNEPSTYDVTFSVDMSNETVSSNGVFVGGGFLGSATEHQLFDEDGDGIYSVTIPLAEGAGGNYIFLNGPAYDSDWGAKEDLAGQECADAANWNDRVLDPVTADTTVLFCFGECSVECPVDPCDGVEGAPSISDDFDGNSVDIFEWAGDNDVTYSIVDGASVGATSSVLEYVDPGSGFYANLQLRTCNKFDMSATNVFTMDVYIDGSTVTGTSPNQIAFKLQNNDLGGNAWQTQIELIVPIDAVDTWQTVEFDFTGTDAMTRDDIDQVVIQFNSEANNDAVTAYIDNLQSSQYVPDTTAPVITLVGDNPVEVALDDTYVDAGATASDDVDGDLTDSIVVVNNVDTSAVGSYTVTYNVSDAAGNAADEVVRTVNVVDAGPYDVTFSVDMSNETVSANGVFVGGGFLGSATAHQLFDEDGDGIYSVTIELEEGASGNYIFLNGPANDGDWGAKEDLAGQECADAANWNDRYLDPITEDTTILFCFGECSAECPVDPCEGVEGAPAIADDFDGNSVDILEWVGDNDVTYSIVDGTSIGATSSVLEYVDPGTGFYANLQLRTCNKFDMSATNVFTMDVYIDGSTVTGTSPNQIAFKLQNNDLGGNAWTTQIELVVPIDAVDTWQTVEFDFTGTDAMTRDDIDQVVIQFNSEANNDAVTAYIDNLQSSQSLGLDDPAMSEFTYFPNPVNDQLTINSQRDVKDITVYNMLGQVVVRQTPNMRNCTVDMSSMQTGAYFVQVSIGNTVETVRVLKK